MIQMVFIIVGTVALMLPSPENNIQPLTWVITALFVFSSFIFSLGAYVLNARKERLFKMIRDQKEEVE